MAVIEATRDLEAERTRLRQRLAVVRREKGSLERELARLEAEIDKESAAVTEPACRRRAATQRPSKAGTPARARTGLPSDPAQLAAISRQAFGGDPFTVRELLAYLKIPPSRAPRVERIVRAAVARGLLTAGPRFGASGFGVEYAPAPTPNEQRRRPRLGVVVDDAVEPAAADRDPEPSGPIKREPATSVPAAQSLDPIKRERPLPPARRPPRSTPLPPVRISSLDEARRAWDTRQHRELEPTTATVQRGAPVPGTGRDVLAGLRPDVRRIVQPAVDAGWMARRANGSHVQFTDPSDPSRLFVVSGSPSDW